MNLDSRIPGAPLGLALDLIGAMLVVGGCGGVVDWCDNVTVVGTGNQGIVHCQRSANGGATFSARVAISNFTFSNELQMTIDKSGDVHIVWGVMALPKLNTCAYP
jgi:hypothetical protein